MEGLMKHAVLAVDWCIPKESYLGQLGLNLFPNVTFEPVKMKCTKESRFPEYHHQKPTHQRQLLRSNDLFSLSAVSTANRQGEASRVKTALSSWFLSSTTDLSSSSTFVIISLTTFCGLSMSIAWMRIWGEGGGRGREGEKEGESGTRSGRKEK